MTTVTVTEQKTTVTATNTGANVTLAGVQGPAGPNAVAGKSLKTETVSANGSIIHYNSSTSLWETTLIPTGLTITGGTF